MPGSGTSVPPVVLEVVPPVVLLVVDEVVEDVVDEVEVPQVMWPQ